MCDGNYRKDKKQNKQNKHLDKQHHQHKPHFESSNGYDGRICAISTILNFIAQWIYFALGAWTGDLKICVRSGSRSYCSEKFICRMVDIRIAHNFLYSIETPDCPFVHSNIECTLYVYVQFCDSAIKIFLQLFTFRRLISNDGKIHMHTVYRRRRVQSTCKCIHSVLILILKL